MGPDELATREELGIMLKFAFSKIHQQAEIVASLMDLLISEGVLSDEKVKAMLLKLRESPIQVRARERLKIVQDFAAIHSIARQYLDPPEE